MRLVGDFLAAEALRRWNAQPDADQFSRSAFNRYYYDAFLRAKAALGTMDEKWAKWPHSRIPKFLREIALERVRSGAKTARRSGTIGASDVARLTRVANLAISELANTLEAAYKIRVIADYGPEVKVKREGNQQTLAGCTRDEARKWTERISTHFSALLRVYDELGLI